MKVPYIFFLAANSLKNLFTCWHGHFWPWLTFKPLFFILLQVTKLPSWRVISSAPYIPGLKHEFEPLQVISSPGNILYKILGPTKRDRCLAQICSPNLNKDMGQSIGPSNFLKNLRIRDKKGV